MIPARRKYINEKRTLTFDFTDKLNAGDSVTTVVTSGVSAGLSITGGPTVVGNLVTIQVEGGTDGSDYTVFVRVNTTQLDRLELACRVEVRGDAN